MAPRKVFTIHTPVRITPALAALLLTIAEQYGNPVAQQRADGLVIYLDSWSRFTP